LRSEFISWITEEVIVRGYRGLLDRPTLPLEIDRFKDRGASSVVHLAKTILLARLPSAEPQTISKTFLPYEVRFPEVLLAEERHALVDS